MSRPRKIYNWNDWYELSLFYEFDPYEEVDFSYDIGGGNTIDYEYLGEYPEREE